MISKLNVGGVVAAAFVFATIATPVYGSETALEIMDNHTKTAQRADKNVTTGAIDLKKEIEQSDLQYLKGMAKYHSFLSRFWSITNKFSGVANVLATIGTAAASGIDFYYRQHGLDSSSGNSEYNSASFAFSLAAFGTNLLELISFRMHNRSEGIKLHLQKAIESENVLETFRNLEGEDLENSEVRASKAKEAKKKAKKAKKDKKIKCTAIVPSFGDDFLRDRASLPVNASKMPTTKNEADMLYLQGMIRKHSCLVRFWRAINGFVEGVGVFATVGATVAAGIDFYYRQNNLAGSSENSGYNNASLALSLSSLGARVLQILSSKKYNKSEKIHVNLRKALYSENALETFLKLEKGEDVGDKIEKTDTSNGTLVLPQIIAPTTLSTPPIARKESESQVANECSEIVVSQVTIANSEISRTFSHSPIARKESKPQVGNECSEIIVSQVSTVVDNSQIFCFDDKEESPSTEDCKQM